MGTGGRIEREFLNTKDAAHYLGLTVRQLEHWRLRGGGPKYAKLGRCVRYYLPDLREWALERRIGSTSEDGD